MKTTSARPSLRFIGRDHNEKRGVGSLCFFLGFLIWQAWSIYDEAMAPKRLMVEHALARAKEAAGLADVKKVYTYYGDEACTVFIGRTKQGKAVVVWVPEKEENVVVKGVDSGISEAEARASFAARPPTAAHHRRDAWHGKRRASLGVDIY